MANDLSDASRLVDWLRAGDRQALTDLFQRHRRPAPTRGAARAEGLCRAARAPSGANGTAAAQPNGFVQPLRAGEVVDHNTRS
jgi:hypothetical protein